MRVVPKVWHIVILISAVLIVLRFNFIINSILLGIQTLRLIFISPSFAFSQIDFQYLDPLLSSVLAIIIPAIIFLKHRNNLLQKRINFTSAVIIILSTFFLLAPLASGSNPDFQKNLSVTKLLPPFSRIKVLHLKSEGGVVNDRNYFFLLKNLVVKRSFDESIVFADSIVNSSNIICYQGGFPVEFPKERVEFRNGSPVVTTKLFLLGTDEYGRDIFARLIYGARISLFVGLGSVLVSLLLGVFFGFLAGYPGGIIDSLISRVTDMFLAFPVIFFIILIIALFGNSIVSVIFVLGFSGWMSLFKIVRGEVISLKNKDYFISARLIGLTKTKLLSKEIMPVIIAPVIVNLIFQYGNVILAEAALSYLGLGTGSSYPSWGAMIEAGQNYLSQAWWMILFPGMALFLTLLAANNLGKEINTYFNPRLEE